MSFSSQKVAEAARETIGLVGTDAESLGSSAAAWPTLSKHFYFANLSSWTTTTLVIIFSLLALEQLNYRAKKKHLPGPTWTIPVIGKFTDSLTPTMKAYHATWATKLSAVSVFNIFIVMASDNAFTRKILNSPTYAEPCLVASAKQILVADNWVFLTGKVHAEYRKGLNVLFTRRALAIYLKVQERIYRKHFSQWLSRDSSPEAPHHPYQMEFRDLNMETSLRVFCGEYIPEEGAKEISDNYWLITQALELVNFPLAIPGTKVYAAVQARKVAVKWFEHACAESKKRMKLAGSQPNCLLDEWVKNLLEQHDGVEKYTNTEMSLVVLSFIFASQDAMSSSVTFGFQFLADYPDVLAKVREEQELIRGGDYESDVQIDQLDKMVYTRAMVKEVLRYRPPVLMVPYMTTKAFPISNDYTVPKGSIVIPSFWNSLHDETVYPDPNTFNPDRFLPGGNSENADPKHWLVFGSGPHKCIGQEYVYMHMTAVLGAAAATMDWTHERTKDSDEIQIIATIFPKDGCRLKFTPRALKH